MSGCNRSQPALQAPIESTKPPILESVNEIHVTDIPPTLANTIMPTSSPTSTPIPTLGLGSTQVSWQDGMTLVYIPEGEFTMGSVRNGSREDEYPHQVFLDAYWIDETEVTNSMFANFLNAIHFIVKEGRWEENHWLNIEKIHIESIDGKWVAKAGFEDHPVYFVNWFAANEYCSWVGRRLPTEAEWEKAARGLESFSFPWGNEFDCAKGNFGDQINSLGNVIYGGPNCDGFEKTAPVGVFEYDLSPYGVKDMAGNVDEWVFDWYDDRYYFTSPYENPRGYMGGEGMPWEEKVIRGGAYAETDWRGVRSASRLFDAATFPIVGFRCAKSEQ